MGIFTSSHKQTKKSYLVNAIVAVICASIFYLALRPALKRSGLLTLN